MFDKTNKLSRQKTLILKFLLRLKSADEKIILSNGQHV
jgi:hypothetical protein